MRELWAKRVEQILQTPGKPEQNKAAPSRRQSKAGERTDVVNCETGTPAGAIRRK